VSHTRTQPGFGKACLIVIVALLLALGLLVAFFFRIPQKFLPSPAKELLSGTPYREEAEIVLEEARAAGIPTEGISLYILPIKGTDASVAYAVLDASQGFTFASTGGLNPVSAMMQALLTGPQAEQMDIARVSLDYRNDEGKPLFVVSAPSDAILAFASGETDQAAFSAALEADINPGNFLTGEWDTITSAIR